MSLLGWFLRVWGKAMGITFLSFIVMLLCSVLGGTLQLSAVIMLSIAIFVIVFTGSLIEPLWKSCLGRLLIGLIPPGILALIFMSGGGLDGGEIFLRTLLCAGPSLFFTLFADLFVKSMGSSFANSRPSGTTSYRNLEGNNPYEIHKRNVIQQQERSEREQRDRDQYS